ncbi:synaptotagmin-15 [Trichonephila clavipes]|nr:synaptotagmin-15 [Trichonephila clavipes]
MCLSPGEDMYVCKCLAHLLISSFSSSASDDVSDTQSPIGKQFRRPLGPSSSLDPTSLLKLTSECVQPRPALTRWHTVASPHCQTTAVLGTLDVEREIDCRVGRNQTTVMWICDRWMQEGTTDRRGR